MKNPITKTDKILGVVVNPVLLIYNILLGIIFAFYKTYKDNVRFMNRLKL